MTMTTLKLSREIYIHLRQIPTLSTCVLESASKPVKLLSFSLALQVNEDWENTKG